MANYETNYELSFDGKGRTKTFPVKFDKSLLENCKVK